MISNTLRQFLEKRKFHSIVLQKLKSNHFALSAKINGIEGFFILDTGASNTCIDKHKQDKFNLAPTLLKAKATGAGSNHIEVSLAKKNTVDIDLWQQKKIKVIILDLSHINNALSQQGCSDVDGIIGADILKRGKAVIDYAKTKLYLR